MNENRKRVYDPEALTLIDGFGISVERHRHLMSYYVHGSRGETLDRICNAPDEELPPNERYALLVAVGSALVSSTIEEIQNAMEQQKG